MERKRDKKETGKNSGRGKEERKESMGKGE